MTQRYLYYNGLTGPMIYEDTYQYPDGKFVEGARLSQACIDADPTEFYHVVRKSYADSVATSFSAVVSAADSKAESAASLVSSFGNLDGGFSDSEYGGVSPLDCGASV